MTDSIFTKIIKGEILSHKIYEDNKTFAFLDIHPVQPGHTLVVSKTQVEFVWDLPAEDYQAVMATVQKIAKRMNEVLDKKFVGIQVVGVDVPHAHIHIIPFDTTPEFRNIPDPNGPVNNDELAKIAQKLAF